MVLDDAELSRIAELATFRRDVSELDERHRAALLDGVYIGDEDLPWWERGVPEHAGEQLAEDLHLMYGIRVSV